MDPLVPKLYKRNGLLDQSRVRVVKVNVVDLCVGALPRILFLIGSFRKSNSFADLIALMTISSSSEL